MNPDSNKIRPPYDRPPITEAVLAIHFAHSLGWRWIDAFTKKRKTRFSKSEDVVLQSATFNSATTTPVVDSKKIGRKLTNADGLRVLQIFENQLTISHLAPYTSWDELSSDISEQYIVLKKLLKNNFVSGVSTRFINRIDIPARSHDIELTKYFNIGVYLPPIRTGMVMDGINMNCSMKVDDGSVGVLINMVSVASPLIDHSSFVIDIDCSQIGTKALSDGDVDAVTEKLHQIKNDIFEACVTDETRGLFQ